MRTPRFRTLFAGSASIALALALPGVAPALGSGVNLDSFLGETLQKHLDAAGLTLRDAEKWTHVRLDLETGEEVSRSINLREMFDLMTPVFDESFRTMEPGTDSHLVAGKVSAGCTDGKGLCFNWTRVVDTGSVQGPARAAYDQTLAAASGIGAIYPYPVRDWTVYVSGHYGNGLGFHKAANVAGLQGISYDNANVGEGRTHNRDQALYGAGQGFLQLVALPWGPNLYISYGSLDGTGAFAFCGKITAPECATPEGILPGAPHPPK